MKQLTLSNFKKLYPKVYLSFIEQMGYLRLKNLCALCNKKIDLTNYHIQVCGKCRIKLLKEGLKGGIE